MGMGLASIVGRYRQRDVAYTVPALGQTGYEKIMPINPQHPDYVVMVLAGYNHDLRARAAEDLCRHEGQGRGMAKPLAADAQ